MANFCRDLGGRNYPDKVIGRRLPGIWEPGEMLFHLAFCTYLDKSFFEVVERQPHCASDTEDKIFPAVRRRLFEKRDGFHKKSVPACRKNLIKFRRQQADHPRFTNASPAR